MLSSKLQISTAVLDRRLDTVRLHGISRIDRRCEPVSLGIVFPRGRCGDLERLRLRDSSGRFLPTQWEVLARWPDGSVRWALGDFLVSLEPGRDAEFVVDEIGRADDVEPRHPRVEVDDAGAASPVLIDTGAAIFRVSRDDLSIMGGLPGPANGSQLTVSTTLTTTGGRRTSPRLSRLTAETAGPVRVTLHAVGELAVGRRSRMLELEARVSFYAGTGLVLAELTLRNTKAARHRGGCWDLGDPGSVVFRDFTVHARLLGSSPATVSWVAEPGHAVRSQSCGPVEIYQDSSGGENWRCRNHVNRDGQVPHTFRGYRTRSPDSASEQARMGLRASPVLSVTTPELRLSGTIEKFWENFPKGLEGEADGLRLRLFPRQFGGVFELLGGEQKTHRVWLELAAPADPSTRPLEWVHSPLVLSLDPECYAATGVLQSFVPVSENPSSACAGLVDQALHGSDSFLAKREIVDEYGWRHFGEVYADHENLHFQGAGPVISHYNNQYDLLYGLLLQFLRTGDAGWFELGRDLAHHVIDIDLYHTSEDKPAYNGGLFWHTDHYNDAHRAGHRSYSKDSPRARSGQPYGGGPSNEHNYTSGLLLFHYLTGSRPARDAVLSLAHWVVNMDDGAQTVLGCLDPGPTGYASATASFDYHGPGRGAGNSINALLDAFSLTGECSYLAKAQDLLTRCIHPHDDIAARQLEDVEGRWSYLVFLQTLGKYLELKSELGERDFHSAYARESLLAYGRWMLDHEVPYMQVLDRVEYPTETWPAHDLRKSAVFSFAAQHTSGALHRRFLEAAEFYFRESLAGLATFETRTCTRPLAILLQNGMQGSVWSKLAESSETQPEMPYDFGPPRPFESQKERVKKLLRSPGGLWVALSRLFRPASLLTLLRLGPIELRRRWA
jgi:YetA-like protein